jgi:hypothetical protein
MTLDSCLSVEQGQTVHNEMLNRLQGNRLL